MKVIQYPYLKDKEFLTQIDLLQIKKQWAKIVLLNWDESPIQEIQGLITSGSLNVTGDSAIRRTGNLSVYLKDDSYAAISDADNLFSINKKMFLEVGFENPTSKYTEYPILWFPMGTFVINNASASHSSDGTSLSLSFKDKMCLLNGDCGGTISSSVEFDRYDTVDENGQWITIRPTIYQIILELVNHFGEEDMSRILIDDVDTRVKQCMKWIGNVPLFVYEVEGGTIMVTTDEASAPSGSEKYEYGDDAGFIYTDFTFPGELVAKPGDSVVSILDKIKNVLGNFEYFYDIEGNFHFREIKNYLNTTQTTNILENLTNDSYYVFDLSKGKAEYDFTNSPLITSYSNSPQYNKVKNDYVVWGTRKDVNGLSIPIRYHLAIDKKPEVGKTYEVCIYTDEEDGLQKAKKPIDYNSKNDFPLIGAEGNFYRALDTDIIYKWLGQDNGYKAININIPEEYQEVEYIESTGTQFIDTRVVINTNIMAETKVEVTTTAQDKSVLGFYVNSSSYYGANYYHLTCYNNKWYYGTNGSEGNGGTYSPIIGTLYNIKFNDENNNIVINDEIIAQNKTFTGVDNSTLSISRRGTLTNSRFGIYKFYYFKVYDKTTQQYVRNFIPCYRKSDNVIGMFDVINNEFYTNAGTGTFLKGNDVKTSAMTSITTTDWRTELYLQGVVTEPYGLKSNYYFAELEAEWPKIYDIAAGDFYPDVLKHPEDLDYWLDFIDSDAAISKISVKNIGRRTQSKESSDINCVFEPEPADLIFIETGQDDTDTRRQECIDRNQDFTQVGPEIYENLAVGGVSNSAYNEVRNLLYQGSSYNESISISTLPIYYLEPNTRITAFDIDSDIHGDYIIKSISLPLDINGTSNISATRALNQF